MQRVEGQFSKPQCHSNSFTLYTRLLQFDDRESRPARRVTDKLAAIREVWDKWMERLPYLYNPGPDTTVDEQLVPFVVNDKLYLHARSNLVFKIKLSRLYWGFSEDGSF